MEATYTTTEETPKRQTFKRHLAAMLAALSLAGVLTLATASSAAAAGPHDGYFSASDGSTATFTAGCSSNSMSLNFDNHGFRKLRMWFLKDGQWIPSALMDVHDTNYPTLPYWWNQSKTGSVALYVELHDRYGNQSWEWIPFSSGSVITKTGYWCGVNGAH